MNLFIAFEKFTNPTDNSDAWRGFCSIFPLIVNDDSGLKSFIDKNRIQISWENIKANYLMLLDHELMYLVFTKQDEIDKADDLYKNILSISHDMISRALLAALTPEIELPKNDNLMNLETSLDTLLNDFQHVEKKVKSFSLDNLRLSHILKNWNSNLKYDKLPNEVTPVVKQMDFFDPKVYEIIKTNPELLKTLDWRVFEEMLADILKTFGYTVELTRKTKDGGIDIIAIKSDTDLGMHKYILQAKRSINAIQVDPVRQLMYLHTQQNATKSIFATTANFTKGAKELAENYHRWTLELKDKEGILAWIDKVIDMKKKLL